MKNETKSISEIFADALCADDSPCDDDCADHPTAPTAHYSNALEALTAVAPQGSTVRVVGFDRADIFLRAGYRVVDGDADVTIARGGEREFDAARKTECKKLILAPRTLMPRRTPRRTEQRTKRSP